MEDLWRYIKERPAAAVQAVQAVLGLLVSFGIVALSDVQTGAILGTVTAVLGFILALSVRPFAWSVVTGLVQSGIVLLAAFGLELDSSQTAAIYALTAVIGAFVVQAKSTPETHLPAIAPPSR